MKKLFLALAGLLALAWAPAFAASTVVAPAGLTAALKAADCGDELLVTAGTLQKWRPKALPRDCRTAPIVITAADPSARPVFAGGATLDGWQGVTIRGVICDVSAADYVHVPCFSSPGVSAAITFEENEFRGRSDPMPNIKGEVELEGLGTGVGGKYAGLIVRRNVFRDLAKGVVLGDSDGVVVEDNDMFDITTDGVQFSGVVKGRFSRNQIVKKALPDASTAHPDGVQGLLGGRPSVDIVIADNLIRGTASGKATQGVFVSDDPRYERLVIARNVVLDTGYRSLSAQGQSVSIIDNVAVSQRDSDFSGLYWNAVTGSVSGNEVGRLVSAPAGSVANTTTARAAASQIDAAHARWLAKFRPASVKAADTERLQAQLDALFAKLTAIADLASR